jgi:hypothetical protein
MTGRRGRRRRKLLDDVKERRGYSHLKEEALDRTMLRARFGRDFRPVIRQTTKRTCVELQPCETWRDLKFLPQTKGSLELYQYQRGTKS